MNRYTGPFPVPAAFLCAALLSAAPLIADEGMWTFDNPPTKLLQDKYHFTPTQEWLDHVRLSSVRLNDGGSGSFVSPHGLLLTNHHVARRQLQNNSTAEHDYMRDGFYAATPEAEMKSPDLEVNILESMENVTAQVQAANKSGMSEKQAFDARKSVIAQIERESTEKTHLRSDVVTLYQGGEYWLYRYKKYTDVRLVFAPEQQTAFFGGDPDNFTFPRHDLDMAIFRVYEDGKPIDSANYLKWNAKGAAGDELVFVSGNPGSTQRLDTLAQLAVERDVVEPTLLKVLADRLTVLQAYSALGPEQARQAGTLIFRLQNSQKAFKGRYEGLLNKNLIAKKESEEADFRAKVDANPEWKREFDTSWEEISQAEQKASGRFATGFYRRTGSELAGLAQRLVQYVSEVKKPDGERLPGFHEAQLESLRFQLLSPAPIYPQMDTAIMTGTLRFAQKSLPANDPWLAIVLNGKTPEAVAQETVSNSKLADVAVRKALLEGGQSAIDASTDPMIVLARKLDPMVREQIKWQEENVDTPVTHAGEKLGKARFLVYGKSTYPDATFTLRLSYGAVKGYPMNGTVAPYKTTLFGLYDRAASFDYNGPWYLPSRWKEGRDKLDLSTPLDFVSTNDIIGGNSGSPVINRNGELVGLIFDGNIESLPGDFEYDGEKNRAVAVHSAAMIEALRKLYAAGKLADELQGM